MNLSSVHSPAKGAAVWDQLPVGICLYPRRQERCCSNTNSRSHYFQISQPFYSRRQVFFHQLPLRSTSFLSHPSPLSTSATHPDIIFISVPYQEEASPRTQSPSSTPQLKWNACFSHSEAADFTKVMHTTVDLLYLETSDNLPLL